MPYSIQLDNRPDPSMEPGIYINSPLIPQLLLSFFFFSLQARRFVSSVTRQNLHQARSLLSSVKPSHIKFRHLSSSSIPSPSRSRFLPSSSDHQSNPLLINPKSYLSCLARSTTLASVPLWPWLGRPLWASLTSFFAQWRGVLQPLTPRAPP